MTERTLTLATIALGLVASTFVSGCRVETKNHGDSNDVKIATPFGGMSVKTDNSAVALATGLPTYPGATPVTKKDKDDHESGAADVNMSFGNFQLRVKAVSYRTADAPDQVLAFYKKGLGRFGAVIQCRNHQPVGSPAQTPDGLTCSDDDQHTSHLHVSDDDAGKTELKAGSRQHQHIVAIDPEGNGTKFGLIALDLPGNFNFSDKDDKGDGGDKDEGKQ